jgi:hypothetical protein
MNKLKSINAEQRLYVIECGEGFTTLGFDYAREQQNKVNDWLTSVGYCKTDADAEVGTEEAYKQYLDTMDFGSVVHNTRGLRCPANLHPKLIGLEGKKVRVEWVEKSELGDVTEFIEFYVGKSTGWMPVHLELKRKSSDGGPVVFIPEGATIIRLSK